ncbi:MAG TPA: hypothetical protein VN696_16380 [Pyrinomonadaceae bacterium]|nr:hypothetical protein [Pyrinomonadaceae bacterium]
MWKQIEVTRLETLLAFLLQLDDSGWGDETQVEIVGPYEGHAKNLSREVASSRLSPLSALDYRLASARCAVQAALKW